MRQAMSLSPWTPPIPFLTYFMVASGRFDPFLADVHHALARVLQRRGKTNEAPAHYRMARKLDATIELDPMCREIMSNAEPEGHRPKGRLASAEQVRAASKREFMDVHPDVGGTSEAAQHANNMRDGLDAWIETEGPIWGLIPLTPHMPAHDLGRRTLCGKTRRGLDLPVPLTPV
jgi:hypothetical protein